MGPVLIVALSSTQTILNVTTKGQLQMDGAFYTIAEYKADSNTFVLINTASKVDHRFYAPSVMSMQDKLNGVRPETYVGKSVKMSYSVPMIEIAIDCTVVD
jgi:hypothetical protein